MDRARHELAAVALVAFAALNCGGSTKGAGDRGDAGDTDAAGGTGASAGAGAGGRGGSGAGTGGGGSAGSGGAAGVAGSGGAAGSGGGSRFDACMRTSQCMVRPRSCCGDCGAATHTDMTAINRAYASSYVLQVCRDTGCPECYMPQDPALVARCEGGACRAIDLNALALTACSANTDCRVRVSGCCECGGNVALEALIAVRRDAEPALQELLCDPGAGCDACLPPYPEGAIAVCLDGRCTVSGFSGATPQSP